MKQGAARKPGPQASRLNRTLALTSLGLVGQSHFFPLFQPQGLTARRESVILKGVFTSGPLAQLVEQVTLNH